MRTFEDVDAFCAAVGEHLGDSPWLLVDQYRINQFADATGDHQWIHVDPERAKDGPFGVCVAHGYLTLSLANLFLPQLVRYERLKMGVNYGCDKVRFPAPVKVGSRVRGSGQIVRAELLGDTEQLVVRMTMDVEGQARPGCVIDTISRYTFNPICQ